MIHTTASLCLQCSWSRRFGKLAVTKPLSFWSFICHSIQQKSEWKVLGMYKLKKKCVLYVCMYIYIHIHLTIYSVFWLSLSDLLSQAAKIWGHPSPASQGRCFMRIFKTWIGQVQVGGQDPHVPPCSDILVWQVCSNRGSASSGQPKFMIKKPPPVMVQVCCVKWLRLSHRFVAPNSKTNRPRKEKDISSHLRRSKRMWMGSSLTSEHHLVTREIYRTVRCIPWTPAKQCETFWSINIFWICPIHCQAWTERWVHELEAMILQHDLLSQMIEQIMNCWSAFEYIRTFFDG